jgi:hypothetical protein
VDVLEVCTFLYTLYIHFVGEWASVAQSSEQAPFTSEIVGSILTTDSCEKSRALPKDVVLRFPPTEKIDRMG